MVAQWLTSDEAALIDFLITRKAEVGDGFNFKGVTWTAAAAHMVAYAKKGGPKTAGVCKNKWSWVGTHVFFLTGADLNIQLKDTYLVVSLLKEQSGFAWDELKGTTITVELEAVWTAYVLVRSLLSLSVCL